MAISTTPTKKDSCQSWIYLSFISVITFFVFGFLDAYGVLLVFLVKHFNEKNSKAAWVGSTAMFGCFFLYPFSLRLRYKYGIRSTVLCAGALLLPVFIFSPMVPSMDLLFVTFSIPVAVACSVISCATVTTITECFERHQGVAFGIRSSMNALGTVMFSFVLPILLSELDWQRTFWILAGISFITICYAFLYNDAGKIENHRTERVCSVSTVISVHNKEFSKEDFRIYRELLQNKELLVYLMAHAVFAIVVFMPPVFMVQFATNLGHPLSKSKWLMIVRGIVAVVIRSIAGRFGDLASRRKKVRFLMLTVIILFSFATMLCSFTKSFTLMMCYMGFISIMDSIYWVVIPLHVKEVANRKHSEHAEHAFALFSCVGSFATLGGPPFLGWIYDSTGDHSPVMQTAFAVSAIAALLVAIRLYFSRGDDKLSIAISEELVNDVFIDEDFPTQNTVVFMVDAEMQYVTVV